MYLVNCYFLKQFMIVFHIDMAGLLFHCIQHAERIRPLKQFFIREWEHAKAGKVTKNCREMCSGCGVRKFGGGVCFETEN